MTNKRLKDWVIPTLGIVVLAGSLFLYYMIRTILNDDLVPNDIKFIEILDNQEETIEVNKEVTNTIIKPYTEETVKISKYFYNKEDDSTKQQQSLIKYETVYMSNTGILYSSDKTFNVVASLEGKVTAVKEDEILGNIVEIEHSNELVTIYQSIKDVKVKAGDLVKQGDIIATSGSNKLEGEKENCLHFEVYQGGSLINPEDFYKLDLSN